MMTITAALAARIRKADTGTLFHARLGVYTTHQLSMQGMHSEPHHGPLRPEI